MADKKGKNKKHINKDQQTTPDMKKNSVNISDAFLDELQGAFTKFDNFSESKRIDLFGKDEYLEQFWVYFKKEHPNLLDKMDKKDLPIYIQSLEDKGFSLKKILKNPETLQKEFSPKTTETQVMQSSLENLHTFCDDSVNNLPVDLFNKFASFAGFHPTSHIINANGKLQVIDDLYLVRKKFLDKEGVVVSDTVADQIPTLLIPSYNPTERLMVEVALKKIRRELKGKLKDDFDQKFLLPITIFSSYQDVLSFKSEWVSFLDEHQEHIDEKLAKKLDNIIVTNGDIKKLLEASGKKFDDTRGFSEWEQYFRRMFNKLATRQLFEEVQKTQESIDFYLDGMVNTFKKFPPYVNQLLHIYPFNDKEVSVVDTSFHADIADIDLALTDLETQYAHASETERKLLRKKIRERKEEREQRRWQAYIVFLRSKEPSLADIFDQLITSKFDFSVLSPEQQQVLVDTLVRHTLEDTIKNKIPELLSVTEEELTQFIHDLFDLQKMDLIVPTKHGPIPLNFVKKEFMSSSRSTLPGIDDLEKLKNLPLNFVTALSGANEKFFEESVMFDSLYYDFAAKNSALRINDAYKVKIKKDGKEVEGYLSSYSPLDERNIETNHDGKELYLYTQPITAPSQERTLVTREGPIDGTPVVIKEDEQLLCDVEILEKQINLNSEALGALLFGYALGQESMNTYLSPKKEEELAKKMGDLEVYKEKNEEEDIEDTSSEESSEKKVEKSAYDKFLDEWKQLKGHAFADEKGGENAGFEEGTRLFIPFADSAVYPKHEGKAWLYMEITKINKQKGTFTVKLRGGELGLGSYEGKSKELVLSASSLKDLQKSFGDVYKLPNPKGKSMQEEIALLQSAGLTKDLDQCFGSLKWDGGKFVFTDGDYAKKEVTHFGLYEASIGEDYDEQQEKNYTLYKIKYNTNGTVSLTGKFVDGDVVKKYSRDMDYPNFLLFIKEKGLQPKSEEQSKLIEKKQDLKDRETKTTVRGFSISNVLGFVKNGFSKITDAVKKYDEERTEDLTDLLTSQGKLYAQIGRLIPSARVSGAFENMSVDYFAERDSRIWKKVEKWKKVYEDADFSMIYTNHIGPMLKGEKEIVPHYKAAAMLLAMIAKGKGPYNRNPEFAAQGMWINVLMGKGHQQRYLAMREKLIRELNEGASTMPPPWVDEKKNEILELEMKYMVHNMDSRQLGSGDDVKYHFYNKYSKQFVDELEKGYTGFFSQSTVEEGFGKVKGATFDFARAEYFRLLGDRPQQAIPFLKTMATKAMNDSQWKVFESAVMAGMLSGVFLTMTISDTQGMIKNICRTRGFVPGIWAKDIHQQTKLQRMLDIFSGGDFTTSMKYNSSKFSFNDISGGTKKFVGDFQKRIDKGDTLGALSKFFKIEGKNIHGDTLLDIYADSKTSVSDKALIKEFLKNSNEKHETPDQDVLRNRSALTGSILTQNQGTVKEMMKFSGTGFAGKDGDEIQNQEAFFVNMKEAIPKHPLQSSEQVKFYMDKFFNRFEEYGFSLTKKTELIKRLKWCQMNPGREEVKDILYYSIVGQVCSNLGRVSIPDEFQDALISWKDFFQNNLDMILQPSILSTSFGGASYKQDYEKYTPKLELRENCVNLLDRELKQSYMFQLPHEQRKLVNQNLTKLKSNKNYLNADLYDLADKLSKDCGIDNRFRKSAGGSKQATVKSSKATANGAKIQNAQVVDKVRAILENKPIINPDDEYMMDDEYQEYDMSL